MVSSRTLGLLVIASEGYRILVVIAMHFLQPDISPLRVPMSAYVFGAYGTLMTISYFVVRGLVSTGLLRATGGGRRRPESARPS